ncbi:trypsin-like peptidase domain-containing protein, partial [Frankia sp. CiP1_Cm_nod2]|uniref:trypsin-like peptidase domain-containing protein n=1 Tax=Frankia sp. CiP1_Cm_nod2 TaxID=2897161 RepID=UPI002024A6FE
MIGRVDTRQLRRHVVRVDSVGGAVLGTGFFVVPGVVVTCAHVVRDAVDVMVVPADRSVHGAGIAATVTARSAAPVDGGALWPFPDLAVIVLGGSIDHPCVLLGDQEPVGGGVECQAWGYPRREYGQVPPGSPASFGFEGVEGDGFFTLKAGQAVPGLSGAPLVCPGRRAVVGVVTATRDETSALGGYAAPVAALWDDTIGDGVPDGLRVAGERIRRHNRPAVRAARAGWHRVLPIDDAEHAVDRPWATFTRQARSSPADLLRPEFGVVPYLFRDTEVAQAAGWCEAADGAAVAVSRVAGAGGTGKTRFAIEVCRRMAAAGWLAGWWRRDGAVLRVPVPRLLVVDYVEAEEAEDLRSMLDGFRRHATDVAPVRVLLLTRTGTGRTADPLDALREEAPAVLQAIVDGSTDRDAATARLTVEQRRRLFTEAVDRFSRAWLAAAPEPLPAPPAVLAGDRYATPLEVLFEAFDRTLSGEGWQPDGRPPVDRVLTHEARYWKATVPGGPACYTDLHAWCVALATLAGAGNDSEADVLLAALPALRDDPAARREIAGWLAGLYDGPLLCNPLRPDRLGEALVGRLLRDVDGGGRRLLAVLVALPSDDQVARCLDGLARLSAGDPIAAEFTETTLADSHIDLVVRAERQASGTSDRPGRTSLLAGLLRLFAGGRAAAVA